MKCVRFAIVLLLIGGLLCLQAKGEQSRPALDLRRLMTQAEFKTAGLTRLSQTELATLNDWLGRFAARVLASVSDSVSARTPEVVESQIDGDFEGWDGETIFKLTNGQIWQQASYAYHYHYAFMPDVTIYRSGGGYKMKVEGVDETVQVRRLK